MKYLTFSNMVSFSIGVSVGVIGFVFFVLVITRIWEGTL